MDKVSSWEDFTTDEFWSHERTLQIVQFKIRPYLAISGKIMFRIWQEVDPSNQKIYENARGSTFWRGPAASIDYNEVKKLVAALERLFKMSPETE